MSPKETRYIIAVDNCTPASEIILYRNCCFHSFWKHILFAMCVDWGPLYLNLLVSSSNNVSTQELVARDPKQKLYKTCPYGKNDTWHVAKHFSQPLKYLIITVNRCYYIINIVTKNRSLLPLDVNIMLGPYKFNLQATVDHYTNSMYCGHYTSSVNCCGKNILLQWQQNCGMRYQW